MGSSFKHPLDHLPSSLTKLSINIENFDYSLDHLPSSLKELYIRFVFLFSLLPFIIFLICSYRVISFSSSESYYKNSLDHLPPTLKILDMNHFIIGEEEVINVDNLPSSLIELKINGYTPSSVDHLPPLLQTLELDKLFNLPVDHLPSSLQCLIIGTRHGGEYVIKRKNES